MRISVAETPNVENYRAYLNGEFVRFCIEANDTAGYVVIEVRDDRGDIVRGDGGKSVTKTLWGLVTIEVPS